MSEAERERVEIMAWLEEEMLTLEDFGRDLGNGRDEEMISLAAMYRRILALLAEREGMFEGWTAEKWAQNSAYWQEQCRQAWRERDALATAPCEQGPLIDGWHRRVVDALALVGDAIRAGSEDERSAILAQMNRLRYDAHVQKAVDARTASPRERERREPTCPRCGYVPELCPCSAEQLAAVSSEQP